MSLSTIVSKGRCWLLITSLSLLLVSPLVAQDTDATPVAAVAAEETGYQFKDEVRLPCSDVKSQGRTGTCWCFATDLVTSFH